MSLKPCLTFSLSCLSFNYVHVNAWRCSNYGDSIGSRPVCGFDGNDYANMCELNKSSCHTNQLIQVKFQGVCGTYLIINYKLGSHGFQFISFFRSLCDTGLSGTVRLFAGCWSQSTLPLWYGLPVRFPTRLWLRWSQLQLSMPPDAGSLSDPATLAYSLQGIMWIW